MTLDELDRSLPNGFHDAEVSSVRIDYVRREVVIELEVWIGELRTDQCETYRPATLTISGLLYCCIEPPTPDYPYQEAGPIMVDTGPVESMHRPPDVRLPGPTPKGAFTSWIYVNDWNACLYISAHSASLEWRAEPTLRTHS